MLIIVAFDGNDVQPYKTDIVVVQPGESVDFIVFTNRPIGNYRMNYFTTPIRDLTGVSFCLSSFSDSFFCIYLTNCTQPD